MVVLLAIGGAAAKGQQTVIKGRVTDAMSGEPMPFVNVYFKGTTTGRSTNFDGYYEIASAQPGDSLAASSLGYQTRVKVVAKGRVQVIDFQLEAGSTMLEAVEVVYGDWENPAWEVLRNVIAHKPRNDIRKLQAYQHESYTKIEIDVDNITEKFREKKIMRKITSVLDSVEKLAGEDGRPVLPVFISESLSDFYYRNNPEKKREYIRKTKVSGVAVTDGTTVSQLIGTSFQQYNFYRNWMSIVEKDFVSPVADSWKLFYDYELQEENVLVEGIACYKITFKPKRPEDLAFTGTMWIARDSWALRQVDVQVGKTANLNFVERIKIQQQYTLVAGADSAWMPEKTRVLIDIGEIRDDWAGMLAKFYVSNKNFVINQPRPVKFFNQEVELDPMALNSQADYWNNHRHEPLSDAEKSVYRMIDTLKAIPVIKTYLEVAEIAINGYKEVGKIDVGPYIYAWSFNNVEGHRVRLGARTNEGFSKKFQFRGYGAYGFDDERFKYSLGLRYIASRQPWTVINVERRVDIDQVGIFNDLLNNEALFNAFVSFGTLRRPFMHTMNKVSVQSDVLPGLTQRLTVRSRNFDPMYPFEYYMPGSGERQLGGFDVSELIFEARFAPGEQFLYDDNNRISLGNGSKPVLLLRYTYGPQGFLNSDFAYRRFDAQLEQSFRLGTLGKTSYRLSGGIIPSTVPYPLLETHLGNESVFFNENSYNMMNFFEFASDRYASAVVIHRFEGLLMNRIPLMRRLKWRLFTSGKVLYGSVSQANRDIIPSNDIDGNLLPGFQALGQAPYVELGYGVENIFRFLRVDFLHRVTYLNEDTRRFGVKLSAQFRL